jgi:hypothetical protein
VPPECESRSHAQEVSITIGHARHYDRVQADLNCVVSSAQAVMYSIAASRHRHGLRCMRFLRARRQKRQRAHKYIVI